MFKINKKGIERKYLVLFFIAIISLVIILYVIVYMKNSQNFSKEACHEAVIYRGTIYEVAEHGTLEYGKALEQEAVSAIHLKCQTEDVLIDTSSKEEIKRKMADEMAACWAMLGEGKVNFFGRGWNDESRCVVCSKISFSGSAKNSENIDNFLEYLAGTNMPDKDITYADFFMGNKEHVALKKDTSLSTSLQETEKPLNTNPDDSNFYRDNLQMAMTDIEPSTGKKYAVVFELWDSSKWLAVVGGATARYTAYFGSQFASRYARLRIRDAFTSHLIEVSQKGQKVVIDPSKLRVDKYGYHLIDAEGTGLTPGFVKVEGPKTVTSFSGNLAANAAATAISKTGEILTFISYTAASSWLDSLTETKYRGNIKLVEYDSDDIQELGCTHLDVVP